MIIEGSSVIIFHHMSSFPVVYGTLWPSTVEPGLLVQQLPPSSKAPEPDSVAEPKNQELMGATADETRSIAFNCYIYGG